VLFDYLQLEMLTVDVLRSYINISLYCTATEAHISEAAIGLCILRAFAMASGSSSSARQPQPLAGPMSTRLEKAMFRYPLEHGAAFVELRDDTMSGEELFRILEAVPGVERVYWQISKHAQGNPSSRPLGTPYTGIGHFLERNVMVKSTLFRKPFEFELTRSMHTKTQGTCSMAFKKAPAGQLLEAWRILRRASMDRVLLSSSHEVEKWHNDIRLKYSEQAKSVWKDVTSGAGSATPGSTISAVVPALASGVSSVTLGSTISAADVHGEHAPALSEESAISAADVEEKLALKKRKAQPVDEGGSSSSGLSSAPATAPELEVRLAELKAKLNVSFGIQDVSLSTIVEQPSSGNILLAGDMSSAWPNAVLGPESASYTPLPAADPVAVFGAGSATPDTAVDHANPESASYTPLPAPDPVAVFGAGSATPDTAVDHVNFDDADFGETESEGADEQPSTAYLAESDVVPGGSKDGKLNATQFAAMKALKAKPRDNVRYRETRNAQNLATEALVETLLMDLAEKPTDSMLPENCETKWFQYGSCARNVSQALPATGFIKPDAAFETGKAWITKQWEESRQVMQHIRLSPNLQERYSTLLSVLPTSTSSFYGAMTTIDQKIAGLLGLLALHRGEVVEISPSLSEWFLAEGAVPAIEDTLSCWSEQFLCLPTTPVPQAKGAGKTRRRQPLAAVPRPVSAQGNNMLQRWEFGQRSPWDTEIQVAADVAASIKRMDRSGDLLPEWKDQVLRSIVPCRQMPTMHWRRVCQCITLGRLFGMLGQDYSADVLYHFYRTRRIVVAKVKKGK
jgi:hypothetical protein